MSLICDTCRTSFLKRNPDGKPNKTILYEKDGPSHCCQPCAEEMKNVNENIARGWFVTTVVDAYIREEEKADKNCVQENKFISPQELGEEALAEDSCGGGNRADPLSKWLLNVIVSIQ